MSSPRPLGHSLLSPLQLGVELSSREVERVLEGLGEITVHFFVGPYSPRRYAQFTLVLAVTQLVKLEEISCSCNLPVTLQELWLFDFYVARS